MTTAPTIPLEPRIAKGALFQKITGQRQPEARLGESATPFALVKPPDEDTEAVRRLEAKIGRGAGTDAGAAPRAADAMEIGDLVVVLEALPTPENLTPEVVFSGKVVAANEKEICLENAEGRFHAVSKSWPAWFAFPFRPAVLLALLFLVPACSSYQPGPLGLSYDPLTGTWTGTASIVPKPAGKEPVREN